MKRSLLFTAAFGAVAFLFACSGGGHPGTNDLPGTDTPFRDLHYDLNSPDVPGDRDLSGETDCSVLALGYPDPMDDPANGYHLELGYNGQRNMRVEVTTCGTPTPAVDVTFEEIEDNDNLCSLDMGSVQTDEGGIASVVISSPQDKMDGECRFKACIAGTDTCVTINVHVIEKVKTPLTVAFADYVGSYTQLSQGKVKLFKKTSATDFMCASLKVDTLPQATTGKGPIDIHTSAKFDTLPGLETDLTQTYTVFCTATEATAPDVPKAYGCVDDVAVEWGAKRTVVCPLDDIPPKIVGSYDITTTLNMVSGLPPQVALVVNYIIDFLDSPTGAILKLMCDPHIWGTGGSALQGLCSNIFVDVNDPQIDNLTTIGGIAKDIIDALLMSLLESQCPDKANPKTCSDIFFTGQNVGDILRKMTLLSTMTCTKEPDHDGLIAMGGCSEKWHTVVIRWTLGKNCGTNDPNCGIVSLSLASLPGMSGTITADIEARLVEKNTKLAITKHPVDLKYGALVDFVLEKILLPQVFGDGSDGLPAVDSFEAMIGSLLAGKACLATNSCCHDFATNLVGQTGGALGINLVEGACDSLITTGGTYVRNFLTGLDTTTSNFTIGTPVANGVKYLTDQPCAIFDKNKDMKFDALGGQPDAQQCLWDATLALGGFDYSPDATFYGSRQ